jgi:hypothetical protein
MWVAQWSMVNGQWPMVNGQWSMVNGQWSMVNGQWFASRASSVINLNDRGQFTIHD